MSDMLFYNLLACWIKISALSHPILFPQPLSGWVLVLHWIFGPPPVTIPSQFNNQTINNQIIKQSTNQQSAINNQSNSQQINDQTIKQSNQHQSISQSISINQTINDQTINNQAIQSTSIHQSISIMNQSISQSINQ